MSRQRQRRGSKEAKGGAQEIERWKETKGKELKGKQKGKQQKGWETEDKKMLEHKRNKEDLQTKRAHYFIKST